MKNQIYVSFALMWLNFFVWLFTGHQWAEIAFFGWFIVWRIEILSLQVATKRCTK